MILRQGVSALEDYWYEERNQVTILAQEFVNVIGTRGEVPDDSTDAYVRISAQTAQSVDLMLDRDGLHYPSSSGQNDYSVNSYDMISTYIDDQGNRQVYDEITPNETYIFDTFMPTNYGETSDSYYHSIVFTPADYEEVSLNNVYVDGVPTSLSGIKTATVNNKYYVISNSQLYYVDNSTNSIAHIIGYPKNLTGSTVTLTKSGPVDG